MATARTTASRSKEIPTHIRSAGKRNLTSTKFRGKFIQLRVCGNESVVYGASLSSCTLRSPIVSFPSDHEIANRDFPSWAGRFSRTTGRFRA